ncbi:hypothetical protein Tsubulata_034828 [Turnera subulata]|uniref:Cysteine proteinase inhibitor n=1 Tax=Turnera subulata TaxID=218843 RepID=A0A9Q0JNG1_9ROSI|nr:hypothetical protein Tsubulata_034828 [Turnera subulata]
MTNYPNLKFIKVTKAAQQKSHLVFKIVKAYEEDAAAGYLYFIILEAAVDGEHGRLYRAKILLPHGIPKKILLDFTPLLRDSKPGLGGLVAGAAKDIPDAATNVEVIELARFAVDEHNKQEDEHLVFKEVVRASEQVVAGFLYRIILKAAKNGDISHFYEAQVLLPAAIDAKVFLEFKPLLDKKRKLELGANPGQPEDVPDASTNDEIIDLARFAVDQENKKEYYPAGRNSRS